MPGDEGDLLVDHLVGDGDRLLRLAGVVADLQHQAVAEHAAGGVDVGDRHFGAASHLLAENGVLAGHRPGGADKQVFGGRAARQPARQNGRCGGREYALSHRRSPDVSGPCRPAGPVRRASRATERRPPISPCAAPFSTRLSGDRIDRAAVAVTWYRSLRLAPTRPPRCLYRQVVWRPRHERADEVE